MTAPLEERASEQIVTSACDEETARRHVRLAEKIDKAFQKFRDTTWKLWEVPDRERADALRFELGREVMGDFHDDLNRVLPAFLLAVIMQNKGRAWLELTVEERREVSQSLQLERATDAKLIAFEKGDLLRPAALVVPENVSTEELKALRDLAKPPLVESLWTRGSARLLCEDARIFQLAVDFRKSVPAILRDIEAALTNYAERLAIPLVPQSRGVKTCEPKSGLMKLGMTRLRREKREVMNVVDTVTFWNRHAPEGWKLEEWRNGDEQMQDASSDVRAVLREIFPEGSPPQ